ncbi:MAG: M56 family metallopeptidase, partial [Candidatus Eremiobacteraeota bacterium]|nr:M56 family metallopeptidase [Candidatus Eremiobacteraeota bacterium]
MIEPRIVVALANSVWQSAILVVFTMMLLRIMSRTSANLRYAVWLATLAVCVLLPALDYGFARPLAEPAAPAPHSLNISSATADTAIEARHVVNPQALQSNPKNQQGRPSSRVLAQRAAARQPAMQLPAWLTPEKVGAFFARSVFRASKILFWLWIVVADVLLARLLFQLISLVRAKRRTEIIDTFDWISQRPGVRRRYSVGISDTLEIPCLLGLTQPLIAIPRAIASELSSNDLRRIVVHESAHVRRYDDWFNLFEQCVLALLFFNPALYYATRALHLEREIACDDQVVASDERLFYAECLSVLAGRTRVRSTSFAPSFFSGRRELLIRIEQLLDRRHVVHARLGIIPYAVAAMLGALALVLGQTGIPVLAAPTQSPNAVAIQRHAATHASSSQRATPAPKAAHPQPIVRATQTATITVRRLHKPTRSVSQSETFVVTERTVCTVAPVKALP